MRVLNFTGVTLTVWQRNDEPTPVSGAIPVEGVSVGFDLEPELETMRLVRVNGIVPEKVGVFEVYTERLVVENLRLPESDEIFVVSREVAEYVNREVNGYRRRFVVPGPDVVANGCVIGCRGFSYAG